MQRVKWLSEACLVNHPVFLRPLPPSTTALPYSTVCERPSIIIQCPSSSVCLDAQLKHVERGTYAGSQGTDLGSVVHAGAQW